MDGMLWFDNDPKVEIKTRIEEGCAYYERKYSEQPNHVIIHPTQYVEGLVVDGIDIHTSRLVTPNHYLIGRKQAVQAAA